MANLSALLKCTHLHVHSTLQTDTASLPSLLSVKSGPETQRSQIRIHVGSLFCAGGGGVHDVSVATDGRMCGRLKSSEPG